MHGLIAWFTRNGVAANLLMLAILAGGIWSGVNQIVLQQFPDIHLRLVTVTVIYPGATPREVEESIITRLEENLYDIEGIKELTATATTNLATVTLEIEDGYSLSEKLDEVTNRVSAIRAIPPEAERPQISLASRSERVITVVLSGDLSEKEAKKLGEQIRDEVAGLPGITLTTLKAVRPYEIAVEVSETALRRYGLTFDQITRAIRRSSVDLSAGSVKTETGRILLRTDHQAYNYDDYSSITVMTQADGSKLKLGDIATVIDGFDETPIVANFNGERAIAIDVFRAGRQNAIDIGLQVKEFVANKQQQLPEGIRLSYWDDDTERIRVRLATMKDSAILGFLLVILILSLFLRPSLAFWVAWGIPVAFAGTFLILPYLGVTLNVVTLMGFITTLGIVVDDAIVTGENVFQHMQRGADPLKASIKGTQEVAVPVIFGVITTMVAFFPLLMQSGPRGRIFVNIPIVVIPILFFSLIESKLVLPAHLKHCANLMDARQKQNRFTRFQRFFADGLERCILKYYRPALNWALINRYVSLTIFVGFLLIFVALVLGERIGFRNFPNIPSDTTTITLQMPAGTTFETTQEKVSMIEATALQLKEDVNERSGETVIRNVFATAGGQPFGSTRRLGDAAPVAGVAEIGEVLIELAPAETLKSSYESRDLAEELRQLIPPIPEAERLSYSFNRFDAGAAMSFELIHPDVDLLRNASADLQRKLSTYDGVYDIEDSYERSSEEFELDLKPEAEYLGVTAANLAQQVRSAFYGSEAQRIQRGRDEVRVMVRYPEEERRSIGSLHTMMIRTATGAEVPFETVAAIVPGRSLPTIRRVDRKRIIQVSADADTLVTDTDAIQYEILDDYLPELAATKYPGMGYQLRGVAADARENQREMILGIYFILGVIYALLAIPFKSYVQPLVVMSAIPFGVVGAIIGHWIMATVFGWNDGAANITLPSIFGMMALSGVVVNDSLVMVHFINRQVKEGMPLGEAVRLAGVRRFRPIMLTSATTFFGLCPLMFEFNPGTAFLVPMAISLAWGILFATCITLMLVPVLVLIHDDLKQLFCRLYNIDPNAHRDEEGGAPSPA